MRAPGVVEEDEEGSVPEGVTSPDRQLLQKGGHFFSLEEMSLGRCDAFDGSGGHTLTDLDHLRNAAGDVPEEGADRGQTLVAGSNVVAAGLLEMSEKGHNPFRGEILEGKLRDGAPHRGGDEAQEEPKGIAVAAHRGWPEPPLHLEIVLEERAHDGAESRDHGAPPSMNAGCAKASKRRFAWRSRASVMVRYVAVEVTSTWPRNVESLRRPAPGSASSRYQRSSVPTAKE